MFGSIDILISKIKVQIKEKRRIWLQMNGQTAHMGQAQMGHHQMGQPHMNPQVNQQMQMQQQQQQQPLCKTNSLPAQYYQQVRGYHFTMSYLEVNQIIKI